VARRARVPRRHTNDPGTRKKAVAMSLMVPAELLEQATDGEVADEAFVECVRVSLPFAWSVISGLVERLPGSAGGFADNHVPPPDEAARGQLLRAMASDATRGALERHFGVRLAFQNCHRVAVFAATAPASAYAEFI
jgi:NucS shadow ORF